MTPMLAVEWSQGIEDAWANIATFVPKLIVVVDVAIDPDHPTNR